MKKNLWMSILSALMLVAIVLIAIQSVTISRHSALIISKADTTSVQSVEKALATKASMNDLVALAKSVAGVSDNVKVLSKNDSMQTAIQSEFAKSLASIGNDIADVERRVVNSQKTGNRNSFQKLIDMGYSREDSWKKMNQMALNPSSKLWQKFKDESPAVQQALPLPANLPKK